MEGNRGKDRIIYSDIFKNRRSDMSEDKFEKNVRPLESVLDDNASIYQNKEIKSEKQKWKEQQKCYLTQDL